MALDADDEAFLNNLLDTLQAKDQDQEQEVPACDDSQTDSLPKLSSVFSSAPDLDTVPALEQQPLRTACGGGVGIRGLGTGSTCSGGGVQEGLWAEADDLGEQDLLDQLGPELGLGGAWGNLCNFRTVTDNRNCGVPNSDPLGEHWNEMLHRFCIDGDDSIVETLLDNLVQSGRDAGALIEALASANLTGQSLETVVCEVAAGFPTDDCLSARSGGSAGRRLNLAVPLPAPSPTSWASGHGHSPSASPRLTADEARAARADVVARLEDLDDPEEARNFMRNFLRGVRQRYLNDCCGDVSRAQTSVVLSETGGGMTARSVETPSVMTIRDDDCASLQSCDNSGNF